MSGVGVFGGAFDPPHAGHLWAATTTQQLLGLDEIWWIPTVRPPHRDLPHRHSLLCRIRQIDQLTADVDGMRALPSEALNPSGTTVALLERLHGAHPHVQLTLLIGTDQAQLLDTWHRPDRLLELAHVAVVPRTGTDVTLPGRFATDPRVVVLHPAAAGPHESSSRLRALQRDVDCCDAQPLRRPLVTA